MAYVQFGTGPRSLPLHGTSRQIPQPKWSRYLIRQAPVKIISESERVSYILEIEEYQIPNETQPGRVFVMRDRFRKENRAVIPLELCEGLRKQLLSCAEPSLEDNAFKKTGTSADGKTTNASNLHDSGPKVFNLSKLNPMEIKNEQLNFQLKIESAPHGSADEHGPESSRRWLSTSPLLKTDSPAEDGDISKGNLVPQWVPWSNCGSVEVYEPLVPDLLGFLMDAAIRYRTIDTPPVVNALYSMSGDRRFYFDLRNTRWGHRLFLSQVTDFHRNVIAIPVETLTDFRDRINTFIEKLNLEEDKNLRDALQGHSAPQRYWKPYPKMRPNFINGAYPPSRPQQVLLDGRSMPTEGAIGVPVGQFTETNVKRVRQTSGSKGNFKSRNRTISRTSATTASATDAAASHRTRQISTSSKGAPMPARQPNGQTGLTQSRDATHRQRQTPNKQQQVSKGRTPSSNHTGQQAGGARQLSRSKDGSDQHDDAQPKPLQSSSRPQHQQEQTHLQQMSRPKRPGTNRTAQQSGGVPGPSRGKPLNNPGEAHDTQPKMPQSPPKQQHSSHQAPHAWNQSAQRAIQETGDVSNQFENALRDPLDEGQSDQTKPQHSLPEQKAQQDPSQQHQIQGGGSIRPAAQGRNPTPVAPTDSSKVEQPPALAHNQQQHVSKPASNSPRSEHGGSQATQEQTTPLQQRREQEVPRRQELEEQKATLEEKVKKDSAAVTSEETAPSASVPEQAPVEANAATSPKGGKKNRNKKKRDPGGIEADHSGQRQSEQKKEENRNVQDNS
uniref:Uncharacterized protein n=1 Tax=Schistocephalus solidus TaxID=70667 RepID=A0A0X3PCN0_SCHSO